MAEPFLIGDTMTGGYGKGPDILHDCTISVDAGEIAVIVGPNGSHLGMRFAGYRY